jgi:hypothetical protein
MWLNINDYENLSKWTDENRKTDTIVKKTSVIPAFVYGKYDDGVHGVGQHEYPPCCYSD